MPVQHKSEQFTWHSSATPHRWARAIPIAVLCAVCAGAGYFIGRTAPNVEAPLDSKTPQTTAVAPALEPAGPLAASAKAEIDEGAKHSPTGADVGRQQPRTQPKPVTPVVVLLNPNSAEKAKGAEKEASVSVPSLHVESEDSADGWEEPRAEKSRRKKKAVSTSRRQERASHAERVGGGADVRFALPRPQSRENFSSRYEPVKLSRLSGSQRLHAKVEANRSVSRGVVQGIRS